MPVNCSSDIGPELTGLTNFYVVQEVRAFVFCSVRSQKRVV